MAGGPDVTAPTDNKEYKAASMRRWRANNPERAKRWAHQMRKWRSNNPAARLITAAKERAKRRGISFTIVKEDILPLPTHCPVLGIKLGTKYGDGCGGKHGSYSLDRIDNTEGYIPGNVIVVSWRANNLKRDATMEELQKVVDFYDQWKA